MPNVDPSRPRRPKDADLEDSLQRTEAHTSHVAVPEPSLPDYPDPHLSTFLKNATKPKGKDLDATTPAKPTKEDDRVVYVGMNPDSSATELASLGALGIGVYRGAKQDQWTVGGRTYDLAKITDVTQLLQSSGIAAPRLDAVSRAIVDARPGSRNELTQIAMAWAKGLATHSFPSRLMLSGHSEGDFIYGGRDTLALRDVLALGRAYPEAAIHVQDLHLAGCNTGKNGIAPDEREQLYKAFPGLLTFWGYQGPSELAPVGQIAQWDAATRGAARSIALTPTLIEKGVAIANADGTFDGSFLRMKWPDFKEKLEHYETYFAAFERGDDVGDPDPYHGSNIYNAYQYFQAAMSRPELAADKEHYRGLAQKALRLRYYEVGVRVQFQAAFKKTIDDGCAAVGHAPVDFAKLSRKDAVAVIADLLATKSTNPRFLALRPQLIALRDLDPNVIDVSWCNHP